MARLNEAPVPATESIEALKRRFIRQNRDLARINTTQSLRIRALEIEQSKLQTENLGLREEILRLHNQLADTADNVQLSHLDRVREEIQRQLEVIGSAVGELGRIKAPTASRPKDQSTWRPAVPMLRLAGLEPRMATIMEDKCFPRRTLGEQEIKAARLSDHSVDSPDLGPPPVAHFDEYADPIKFDQPRPIVYPETIDLPGEDLEHLPEELSSNLETRRRRRSSRSSMVLQVDDLPVEVAQEDIARRTSTKRKLSARETEEQPASVQVEPFNFTRRTSSQTQPVLHASEPVHTKELDSEVDKKVVGQEKREREILGDKSVNTSPRKNVQGKKAVDSVLDKLDIAKPRARRPKASQVVQIPPQDEQVQPETSSIVLEQPPPKTPAADVFSPAASEPSSLPQQHEANLEGMTRPSRRARAVTNYAEPSLNTKMRRPNSDLVDAIYSKPQGGKSRGIKAEIDEGESKDWKSLPSSMSGEALSPLHSKTDSQIPKPVSPTGRSPASIAISTLRLGERPKSAVMAGDGLSRKMQELDLSGVGKIRPTEPVRSRRHSSMASLVDVSSLVDSSPAGKSSPVSVEEEPSTKTGSIVGSRIASRRRSMVI